MQIKDQSAGIHAIPMVAFVLLLSVLNFPHSGICQDESEAETGVETVSPRPEIPGQFRKESSTSSTGQFVVFGGGLAIRSAFCVAAEDIKRELRRLLDDQGDWKVRILISLNSDPKPGRSVTPRVFAIREGGMHFQLDVKLNDSFKKSEFSQQLARLLIAELMIRGTSVKAGSGIGLPDWVAVGLTEAIENRKRIRPSARFAAVFQAQRNLGVDEIMDTSPWGLDSVSREIYEVSCCALVEILLSQQEGVDRLKKFLNQAASYDGDIRELLASHFPGIMLSPTSLRKWWSVQMASLASGGAFEALDAQNTETRLREALVFAFPKKEQDDEKKSFLSKLFGKKESKPIRPEIVSEAGSTFDPLDVPVELLSLEDYEMILKRDDREKPLLDVSKRLSSLRVRAYPLYRPLIYSYEQLVLDMVKGKKAKEVGRLIEQLAQARAETLAQARGVESYMDWFEGTQVSSKSGAFEDYRRAIEELEALEKRRKTDQISRYLDALESEY